MALWGQVLVERISRRSMRHRRRAHLRYQGRWARLENVAEFEGDDDSDSDYYEPVGESDGESELDEN